MRHITTLLLCVPFWSTTTAQIINGSFELGGAPSLEGWEWTCGEPGQPNTAAPGYGSWCATKQPGQAKGCFPSYLFQRLADVENGDLLTLSGWVRCGMMPTCVGAGIGLASLQNGVFELEETTFSTGETWTYLTITDTVEIGINDTAVVLLNSGFIGGPIGPEPAYFDGIAMLPALSVVERSSSAIGHLVDRAAHRLYISAGTQPIIDLRLFDLTGRTLPMVFLPNGATVQVDLSALPGGVYFAQVRTKDAERTIRFTTW